MSWRGWRFRALRTRHALHMLWEGDPWVVSVRNAWFWINHPRLWLRVQRYREAFRQGQEVIEA